eukprot:SAG11_NODE_3646_length_2314_cov_8.740406_2_plen_173_part_01
MSNLAEAAEEKQTDAGGADSAGESAPAPTTVMPGGGRQTAGCTRGASAFGVTQAESQAVTPSSADGIKDKIDRPRGGRKDAPRRVTQGSMGPLGADVDVDGRLPTRHDGLDARWVVVGWLWVTWLPTMKAVGWLLTTLVDAACTTPPRLTGGKRPAETAALASGAVGWEVCHG